MANKKTILNYIFICLWSIAGGAIIGLLLAAANHKDIAKCQGIDINIHGINNNFFIQVKDIRESIVASIGMQPTQKNIGSFNLQLLEAELEKNTWIKKAKLFFDNNKVLHVEVFEREPIARIFTTSGATFYIDTTLSKLPVQDTLAAHVQVFSSFPTDNIVLSKDDSMLLADVKNIAIAIQQDSFCMAMIDQIDITTQRKFEMIPKIGNHVIQFGDATNIENKIGKLKQFYAQIFPKAGMNYYATVNVQYDGQVVAKKRSATDVAADSIKTLQIMQFIADNAARRSADSLETMQQDNTANTADSSMVNQSVERDDAAATGTVVNPTVPITNPSPVQATNRPLQNNPKPPVQNQAKPPTRTTTRPSNNTRPRAIMQRPRT